MVRRAFVLIIAAFLFASGSFTAFPAHSGQVASDISLTEAELAWLESHEVIRVAPDPDFPPVESINSEGVHEGIAADFMRLVEQRVPLRFEVVNLGNWNEVLRQARSRDVDMLSAAVPTKERLEYLKFTSPFVRFPAVVLVREKMIFPPKVHDLEGLTVAVVNNYAAHEFMRNRYPDLELEVMPDIASGLRQVSFGRVDAMVLNIASATHYIEKLGITNLRIFRDTEFTYDLSFAVRSDWPELQSILQKALDSISPDESRSTLAHWVSVKRIEWRPNTEQVAISLAVAAVLAAMAIFGWVVMLRRTVSIRTAELKKEFQDRLRVEDEKELLKKQMERAKKMEALGLLAGGVAHDLNNILSSVIGYPELMLSDLPADSPLKEPLETIKESGLRAAEVVADLLTVARGVASTREDTDICLLIKKHFKSPEHRRLVDSFPSVVLERRSDGPCIVNCSPVHIRKTLQNLLSNAFEALPDGKGTVAVSAAHCTVSEPISGFETIPTGDYVRLSVADDGQGISSKDFEHVFEPFYTKKVMGVSGTGLGLAVVWNTVHDHGGYLDLHSKPGETSFDLYFPASEGEAAAERTVSVSTPRGRGQLVLVVDDEPVQRKIAAELLTFLGYEPVTAATGDEAVKIVKERDPEFVLLDMILSPGEDGCQVYERLLAIKPQLRALITSGYAETVEVKRAQSLGAGAYIKKPYTAETLNNAIYKELNRTR